MAPVDRRRLGPSKPTLVTRMLGKAALASLTPGGSREGGRPTKTGSERSDTDVRGWSHGQLGEQYAPNVPTSPRGRATCRSGDSRVDVITPPPLATRQVPKPVASASGVSRRDCTGNQRVRVLVVESLGSRHRSDASTMLGRQRAARRFAERGSSPKEAFTPFGTIS